jgi:hypothetical protein
MSTLAEIEAAIPHLTVQELAELEKFIQAERQKAAAAPGHSVLDIPTASVGELLPAPAGDLLEDMLEGRK